MTVTHDSLMLPEFCDFQIPPDVILEKELCWPVENDLEYN